MHPAKLLQDYDVILKLKLRDRPKTWTANECYTKSATRDRHNRTSDTESDDSEEIAEKMKKNAKWICMTTFNRIGSIIRIMERQLNVSLPNKRKRMHGRWKTWPKHETNIRCYLQIHLIFFYETNCIVTLMFTDRCGWEVSTHATFGVIVSNKKGRIF